MQPKIKLSGINIRKKQVFFDQILIKTLTSRFESPFFIFSQKRLIDNYQLFYKAFNQYYRNTGIYYSIKTNYETKILKTLLDLNASTEAASYLEILLAEKAGFRGQQIILDGPAWTDEDIANAIKKNIKTFNVDSVDELIRLNTIAKRINKRVRISFRIFPEIKMSILKSFIEGYIAKFGVPISRAVDSYRIAKGMSHIEPIAISTHIGSMITDPSYYEKAVDRLIQLASILKSELNINIEEINIGGGYGIQSLNYYSLQNVILEKAGISNYSKAAPIEDFGKRIANRFKNQVDKYNLGNLKLILEPGRFIVSDTGILVTKVVAVKDKWIFIDGGINLIPESIFFIRRGFIVANKINSRTNHKYNIAGPSLNTADVLAVDQKMPKMEVGDVVIVLDAGAYSLSRSNQFTLLRPDALFITDKGQLTYLRKKESPSDILNKLL
ncbi:MAG: alanine racemase [Candidatus Daviesbacteria bacterium]|nr:alanine racemase [Candidatus Daviesbacteria bacterium]